MARPKKIQQLPQVAPQVEAQIMPAIEPQPPQDNEHVAPGAEQFPEPELAPVAPIAEEIAEPEPAKPIQEPEPIESLAAFAARIEEQAQPLAVCRITHPEAVDGGIHEGKYAGIRLVKGDKIEALIADGSTL
jgi:hypothetical protein